jgi:large subunit ribosomal protein L25
VAGDRIKLEVQERELRGSRESRRLRHAGLVPGILYGRGKKPHAISIPERELRRVLSGDHGLHTILDVVLEGQKTTHASILKDFQIDPLRERISHVDLQEVRLDQPIHATVVIELVGEAPATKTGGVLSQVTREVSVEALPMEVPDRLELDVSAMEVGDTLRLSDLQAPDGVTLLDDPETVMATATLPTRAVEAADEEGAAAPSAEGAPQGGSEAPADPDAPAAGGEGTVPG